MADVHNELAVFQEFREALGTRDPKTIATYRPNSVILTKKYDVPYTHET